jgi:hypothetical protein
LRLGTAASVKKYTQRESPAPAMAAERSMA